MFQDPAYVPVPGTHDADMYAKQNTFIYNMLATRVTGGMALTLVRQHEVSQDGRPIQSFVQTPMVELLSF